MRARIHRGAHEIGGNCVELESGGFRLLLDLGRPLTATHGDPTPLPEVAGLVTGADPTLLGVIISHPHPDHCGLLDRVPHSVPIYIGRAACRILDEAALFSPAGIRLAPAGYLEHRVPFRLGPFTITPYLVDHSAFDAYALLVEADGHRLLYTGDLRAHGRKARLFEELLGDPPRDLDVLLMEGTRVREGSDGSERGPSEREVEDLCVKTFRTAEGMVLAAFSPQNIDRLVTIYRACLRSGRDLVLDLYGAAIAAATGRDTIPQAHWDRIRVYLPWDQKRKVIRAQAFDRTDAVRTSRIYPEELSARPGELVMLFRGSMSRELERHGCLAGARLVWSIWPGYLREPPGLRLQQWLDRQGIELLAHHASGHASIGDLQRLVQALAPHAIVPIHSEAGNRFDEFFSPVSRRGDGEWWPA